MIPVSGNFDMTATTLPGLEDILAGELLRLGAQQIRPGIRSVMFSGDAGFLYKANFALRTAIRVLVPVARFKVRNEKELYRKLFDLPWETVITGNQTFAVDAFAQSDVFRNTHYLRLRTKDAIADRFVENTGKRPDVDREDPDISVSLHINRENVTVSLDSSGQPLFKRGYRLDGWKAPMSEVLAAGLLHLAGWEGKRHFVDPMCGSGTLVIEAAMMALNMPAQLHRKSFAFMNWPGYDAALFATIREGLVKRMRDTDMTFTGFDRQAGAVKAARANVRTAMLEDYIRIEQADFFESHKTASPVMLMFNPPYGERLAMPPEFYRHIGDTLKNNWPGATAWMLTADLEGLKSVGLRTSAKIPVKNAALDCRFVRYDLYEGSKKAKFSGDPQ